MDFSKLLQRIKLKHLCYLLIFLTALITRFIAADRLAATNREAAIFLNLTSASGEAGQSGSILYQILTKPLLAMFGDSILVLRFWVVIAGGLISLLPLLYEDALGKRTAVILSFLLALDPFQIANGIQADGSSLTMLALFAAVGFFIGKKYGFGVIASCAFLFSGSNVQYGIALVLITNAIISMFELSKQYLVVLRSIVQYLREKIPTIIITACFVVLLFFIQKIPFSDFFSHMFQVFQNWRQPYALGSYPQLFPLALLSYMPIALISLYPSRHSHIKREVIAALYLGLLVMILITAFYPGHSVSDLVWVSLAICVLCAIKINNLVDQYLEFTPRNHLYTLILAFVLISIAIHFGMLVYKFDIGYNLLAELLSMITLLVLFVMVVVFVTYNESVSLAINSASVGFLILLITVQLAFSWRAAGLNGNPSAEILWGGYFEGEHTLDYILKNADLKSINSELENKVAFQDYDKKSVEWSVAQKYKTENKHFGLGDNKYAVAITETNYDLDEMALDGYYGQDFVAESYPLWTWKPFESLLSGDYWTWLLKRQNEQVRTYHYVWLNKNLF